VGEEELDNKEAEEKDRGRVGGVLPTMYWLEFSKETAPTGCVRSVRGNLLSEA
jgi:hypothetical protein